MPLVLLALTAGYGAEQNAQKQDAEARFVAIEQELASVQEYLQAQSRSASELAKALDESEKAGFTYGINPNSRKVQIRTTDHEVFAFGTQQGVGPKYV